MRKIFLSLFISAITFGFSAAVKAQNYTLLKRTIQITPQKYLRYWKNPKAAEPVYDTNSWYPNVRFEMLGPLESGSNLYVEIDKPTGALWLKIKMQTPVLGDDEWDSIKPESIDSSDEEKLAAIDSGLFPFRIKLKNALAGTDKVLFSGKFKVNLLSLDQNIPENKGKKEFMVDYDWLLPVSYVWLNPQGDADVPYLSTQVILKGQIESGQNEAYLFYNGKQIGKTNLTNPETLTSGANEPHHRYNIMQAGFMTVRGFNKSSSFNDWSGTFFLDKNPGNYEIKILRSNQLVRTISFTVGADGKIVDNSVAKNAQLGGVRMIFPAKISGNLDGQFNAAAWQSEALFFNPLAGFAVQ